MGFQLPWVFVMLVFMTVGDARRDGIGEVCNPNDLKGLIDFKNGICSDSSGRLKTWVGHSCCKWAGIYCDNSSGRVTRILLSGLVSSDNDIGQFQMEGSLSPSITLLTSLEVIDLSQQFGVAGQIPPLIGLHLRKLQKLYLNRNSLSGPLPASMGKLSQIEEIILSENQLSGSLPASLGNLKKITTLQLDSNQFSGSIPDSITNLRNLLYLDLSSNSLTGHIPAKIGNLQALQRLHLSNNSLSGKIPPSVSNLTAISDLSLNGNFLEGEIPFPSSSSQMPSLGYLELNDNQLTGRIPPAFGYLVSLRRLSLANNKLEGEVPSIFGNLSALQELYLQGNQLSGRIPKSIGQVPSLLFFSISHNLIHGPLPREISSLRYLQILDLSFNHLNLSFQDVQQITLPSLFQICLGGCGIQGEIPEFLRTTFGSIKYLDLSANYLTGSLPAWLGNLTYLYHLNLSSNLFVSEIPDSFMNLHALGELDLHSNKLSGPTSRIFQMGSQMPLGSPIYVDLSDNNFSGGIKQLGAGDHLGFQRINLSRNSLKGGLPTSIGRLALVSLDLSYNELSSYLPEAFGSMGTLQTLKLQKNKFTGEIPRGFLKLTELKELDLSDNLLVGKIPDGKPLSDFPKSSYSGNRGLCGRPLPPCET